VNFEYLTQLLENYGFDLVSPEEAATTLAFPMPDGTDTFDGMFHQMELDCKHKSQQSQQSRNEYGSAMFMRPEEKQISFYNRYFIFRKNRNINAKHLKSSFLTYAGLQEEQDRAVLDESTEKLALDKIARASAPIDVASKPAIAAHIIQKKAEDVNVSGREGAVTAGMGSGSGAGAVVRKTIKAKPKPKPSVEAADAAAAEGASAPIEQIEKKIRKQTKKMVIIDDSPAPPTAPNESSSGGAAVKKVLPRKKTEKLSVVAAAAESASVDPKNKTKKKQ
jgi:hypothetical protein